MNKVVFIATVFTLVILGGCGGGNAPATPKKNVIDKDTVVSKTNLYYSNKQRIVGKVHSENVSSEATFLISPNHSLPNHISFKLSKNGVFEFRALQEYQEEIKIPSRLHYEHRLIL